MGASSGAMNFTIIGTPQCMASGNPGGNGGNAGLGESGGSGGDGGHGGSALLVTGTNRSTWEKINLAGGKGGRGGDSGNAGTPGVPGVAVGGTWPCSSQPRGSPGVVPPGAVPNATSGRDGENSEIDVRSFLTTQRQPNYDGFYLWVATETK